MKIEEQVLSIEQVEQLRELGFDVAKYGSMYYHPNWIEKFGVDEIQDYHLAIGSLYGYSSEDCFPTMTIGDIINILPVKIEEDYFLSVISEYCAYSMVGGIDTIFYTCEKELINNLFKTLVWCIKNKYIAL